MSKQELAEELQISIIKILEKWNVDWPITENIWGADLAVMQLISKFNK